MAELKGECKARPCVRMRTAVFANSRELERFAERQGLRRQDVVSVVWAEPLGGLLLTWFGE